MLARYAIINSFKFEHDTLLERNLLVVDAPRTSKILGTAKRKDEFQGMCPDW